MTKNTTKKNLNLALTGILNSAKGELDTLIQTVKDFRPFYILIVTKNSLTITQKLSIRSVLKAMFI